MVSRHDGAHGRESRAGRLAVDHLAEMLSDHRNAVIIIHEKS
jgi:hypothetical protein